MRIFAFILVISFSAQAGILNVCSLLIRKNISRSTKSDLQRLDFINKLDDANAFLRNTKINNDIVEINRMIDAKIATVDIQLFQGRYAYAHRSWRGVFRKVEVNYSFVVKQQQIIDDVMKDLADGMTLLQAKAKYYSKSQADIFYKELAESLESQEIFNAYVKSSEKQIRKRNIIIGNSYHEYKLTRSHLENLSKQGNCKADCDKAVKQLLEGMGLGSENIRLNYPMILKGRQRPTMKLISNHVHSTPIAYETRLFKETIQELKAVIRDIAFQGVFQKLFKFVERKFPFKKSKLIKIFNLVNDGSARINHFPKINDIVRRDIGAQQQYHLLREQNTLFEKDELLVSFSRRIDSGATQTWGEMKTFLKQVDATDTKSKDFLDRMIKADEIAKLKGDLSLNYKKSKLSKLLVVLGSGGGTFAYFHFDLDKDKDEVSEVSDSVVSVIDSVSNEQDIQDNVSVTLIDETTSEGYITVEQISGSPTIIDPKIIEYKTVELPSPVKSDSSHVTEVHFTEAEVNTAYTEVLEIHQIILEFNLSQRPVVVKPNIK
jgi:hypothetical protein